MGNHFSSQTKTSCASGIGGGAVSAAILYFFSAPVLVSTIAFVIVGGLTALGIYKYMKSNGKNFGHKQLFQTQSVAQLSRQELEATEVSESIPKLPQWKKIELSDQDLQQIKDLTNLEYDIKAKLYRCKLSKHIMRQPVTTKCCNMNYQKIMFLQAIQKVGVCPNPSCDRPSSQNEISRNYPYEDAIEMFRLQVRKIFRGLKDCQEKKQWKKMIEEDFGKSYIEKYL